LGSDGDRKIPVEKAKAFPLRKLHDGTRQGGDWAEILLRIRREFAKSVELAAALLISGSFRLPALTGRLYPIRPFPAWFLLPLLWKFVTFHRRVPFSSAFKNPQGFGAIGTATPFLKILFGTQSRNLFRHGHIDELV
jgi:hypothetical protein